LFSGYGGVSQLTWAGEDVYVTGSAVDGGGASTGLILRSSDYGTSWSTNFASTNEIDYTITSDPAGNIYSAGNSRSSTNSYDWVVRKAAPGGTNWTVIDTVQYGDLSQNGSQQASPASIAVNAAGNASVAGRLTERWIIYTTNIDGTIFTTYGVNQRWFIRQYSVATGQWNTNVFSYSSNQGGTNEHAVALGTALTHDRSTFVVGYGTSDSGQRRWVVRKRAAAHPPRLQIAVANGSVTVSWPAAYTNCTLEWTDSTGVNPLWQTFSGKVSVINQQNAATFDLTPGGARLFRLTSNAEQIAGGN
jgi:hypothetical protein